MKQVPLPLSIGTFPPLPDHLGFGGMFAGQSQGKVWCMGGTNFPGKKPWEGGKKAWSDRIFAFDGHSWSEARQKLPAPVAYGVSVSWQDRLILVGGNNEHGHSRQVLVCSFRDAEIGFENYPSLPFPLSLMCGTVLGDLILLTGGISSDQEGPRAVCLGLDLQHPDKGWFELPACPGPERMLAVCTACQGRYYLFGGETTLLNKHGHKSRHILQDAWCFRPERVNGTWTGTWEGLAPMPRGVSAGPSPLPVIEGLGFVFWGGVDALTALHKSPESHPGMCRQAVAYQPGQDAWQYLQHTDTIPAGVTLPVVGWQGRWLYLGGETKPGLRTNAVYSLCAL